MKRELLFLGLLAFSPLVWSEEAFIIRFFHDHVAVTSPPHEKNPVSVILENKTLTRLRGKLANKYDNLLFFALKPGQTTSLEVEYKKKNELILFPLSPPLEEIRLTFTGDSYEIPEKQ